ncbi:gp11 [Burkholderia phage BcepC6B]|uniref:Gp11 n=1 Tax=Burkholderia phage BcepC6B TaxID=2883949 RepID=Q6J1R6_9CAUD|nr:tail protein [Burkholderia phage BcepC6B]AAT38370.1 gp11 [Burkholderia phage BcepC6B]
MASQVGICNRALTKIGDKRITSLDEDSKAAATLNSMYDDVLDACLRAHVWSFTKARAQLAALAEAPLFGFSYQYRLPTDFIRLLQVGQFDVYPRTDTRGLFSIENGNILTDMQAPLYIRYAKRVTDPNAMDALFREAFACRLAAEACESLTQSATKRQGAWAEHDQAIAAAIRVNAIERPAQPLGDDTWLESRNGVAFPGETPIIRS